MLYIFYKNIPTDGYKYWNHSFQCWTKFLDEATRFDRQERDRLYGKLLDGFFVDAKDVGKNTSYGRK